MMRWRCRCDAAYKGYSDRAELKFASQRFLWAPLVVAEFAYHATRKNAADYVVPRLQNPDEH